MPTFKVTYPNGKGSYVETCDAENIDDFCNRHFGSVDYEANGITVEIVDGPIEDQIQQELKESDEDTDEELEDE